MLILDLNEIKVKRVNSNISLQEMADSLGFKDASTYMRYENGLYAFKANHLPVLAEKLKCSIESLFLNKNLLKSQLL
jgi:transcriptional regulator with XRE-family HTH domain